MRIWGIKRKIAIALVSGILCCTISDAALAKTEPEPAKLEATITIDPQEVGTVIPEDWFGVIQRWTLKGNFAVNEEGELNPKFVEAAKKIGITNLRTEAGNVGAQGFLFDRCIGPMENRKLCYASDGYIGQFPYYGPDEWGEFCDQIGATMSLVMNLHRSNLQEQVNWLHYMLYPAQEEVYETVDVDNIATYEDEAYYDPQYWGNLRAANGHFDPYPVTSATWGNEESTGGWLGGKLVKLGDHPDYVDDVLDLGDKLDVAHALYIYGGTVEFEKEPAITFADLDEKASLSTGEPNQVFYAHYRKIDEDYPFHIFVGEEEWRAVDTLEDYGPEDKVCVVKGYFGEITFGDGVHGAIPERDALISVTNRETHCGYVDVWNEIEKFYPDFDLYINMTKGLTAMPLIGTDVDFEFSENFGLCHGEPGMRKVEWDEEGKYYYQDLLSSDNQYQLIQELRTKIKNITGRDKDILIAAWGRNRNWRPKNTESSFMMNHASAMVHANQFMEYLKADMERNVMFQLNDAPLCGDEFKYDHPADSRTTGLIYTDANMDEVVIGAKGWAMYMYSVMAGTHRVATEVESDSLDLSDFMYFDEKANQQSMFDSADVIIKELPLVKAMTTVDDEGNLIMVVVNNSFTDDCRTAIHVGEFTHAENAEVITLNSGNVLDMNTYEEPDKVVPVTELVDVGAGDFEYTFPAHSCTRIMLSKAGRGDLKTLVELAEKEAGKTDCYTADSIEKLKAAIEEAWQVLNDDSVSDGVVLERITALQRALDELEFMESESYTDRIKVTKKPDKMVYEIDDKFESDGMEVTAYLKASCSNATASNASRNRVLKEGEYEIEHEAFDTAGIKKVTVTYQAENKNGEEETFADSFTVKVNEAWDDYYTTGIKIKKGPDKTTYKTGEEFNPAGMKVVACEIASPSNAERRERELNEDEYEIEIPSFKIPGTKTIRVSYEAKGKAGEDRLFYDSFTVKVTERSSSGGGSSSSGSNRADDSITGTWVGGQDNSWKFRKSDGSYVKNDWAKIRGLWYHFDEDGNMQTGWVPVQDKWYLLNSEGIMHADEWILMNGRWYFLNADGSMKCNEWFFYKNFWYYLGKDGDMLVNCMTPDGYAVDGEGRWIKTN